MIIVPLVHGWSGAKAAFRRHHVTVVTGAAFVSRHLTASALT